MQVDIFHGFNVRTEVKDNKVWFALQDVLDVLGSGRARDVVKWLRERDRETIAVTDNLGRPQSMWFINERGLIRVMQNSRSPLVEQFQDWADERIEQLMSGHTVNTAGVVAPQGEELIALAVLEAQKMLAEKDQQIAQLSPKAAVFDEFLTAEGSYEVGDAAKLLNRAGIETGPIRLFTELDRIGWTFKRSGVRRIKQKASENELLVYKAQSYRDPNTHERKTAPPQIRITPKGLEKLRLILQPTMAAIIEEEQPA